MNRPVKTDGFMQELIGRAGGVEELVFGLAQEGVKISASALHKAKKKQVEKIRKDLLCAAVKIYFKNDWNEAGKYLKAPPQEKPS